MDLDTNKVYRELAEIPEEIQQKLVKIQKRLQPDAEKLLDGKETAQATKDTREGKRLIEWAKREKARQERRAQRKARRKNR